MNSKRFTEEFRVEAVKQVTKANTLVTFYDPRLTSGQHRYILFFQPGND